MIKVSNLTRIFVVGVAFLYCGLYLVWRLLLLTPLYDRYWQLQVSEIFGSWSYLPLMPLLLMVVLYRSRLAVVALLLPALFFAYEYGSQFLPNWHTLPSLLQQEAIQSENRLRILSWNMLYTRDRDLEFRQAVHKLEPDIIALQEVGYGASRTFLQELQGIYPYQAVAYAGSRSSLAIISRLPIMEEHTNSAWDTCQCQQARLDWHGQEITLINVHPWSPQVDVKVGGGWPQLSNFSSAHQNITFDKLLEKIILIDGPLIVLGDMNTTERQPNYRRMRIYLEDAFAAAGWGMGYTFPNFDRVRIASILPVRLAPFVRIDHIFYNDFWVAYWASTGKIATSDHLYVTADLLLK